MGVLEDLVSCSESVFLFLTPGSFLKNLYFCFVRFILRAHVRLNVSMMSRCCCSPSFVFDRMTN